MHYLTFCLSGSYTIQCQNGASSHFGNIVHHILNECFQYKWIRRGGLLALHPRSLDLIPLDSFLRGYVKNIIYQEKTTDLRTLQHDMSGDCNSGWIYAYEHMVRLNTTSARIEQLMVLMLKLTKWQKAISILCYWIVRWLLTYSNYFSI